jgi:hypothetical protein
MIFKLPVQLEFLAALTWLLRCGSGYARLSRGGCLFYQHFVSLFDVFEAAIFIMSKPDASFASLICIGFALRGFSLDTYLVMNNNKLNCYIVRIIQVSFRVIQ